jgi:hypothetical protein
MTKLKRKLPFYFHYKTLKKLVSNPDSYLHQTGWLRSLREEQPVDNNGAAIPWMNFPVVAFLRDRLTKDLDLFEYGSGHSTLFFARLVKSVTSVESNEAWFSLLKVRLPGNAELRLEPANTDASYCRAVHVSGRKYDVVVVDGTDRVNCVKQGLTALSPDGIMILDDSQREAYAEGISRAKASGFRALFFEGLKPSGNGVDRTTVFYRRENCLGI